MPKPASIIVRQLKNDLESLVRDREHYRQFSAWSQVNEDAYAREIGNKQAALRRYTPRVI